MRVKTEEISRVPLVRFGETPAHRRAGSALLIGVNLRGLFLQFLVQEPATDLHQRDDHAGGDQSQGPGEIYVEPGRPQNC